MSCLFTFQRKFEEADKKLAVSIEIETPFLVPESNFTKTTNSTGIQKRLNEREENERSDEDRGKTNEIHFDLS